MLLPKTPRRNIAVLVTIDHFSKWLNAVPIKDKKASTVARVFNQNVLPNLPRLPKKVLSDNGPEFRSQEFNDLLKHYNIEHTYSTLYKASSNGCVERSNRTITELLKGIVDQSKSNWDLDLAKALIIHNSTIHSKLGKSPSDCLMNNSYNAETNLPIDNKIKETWKSGHPKFAPFEVGQKILKKIVKIGNRVSHKLTPKFDGPYKIIKVQPNTVTYEIERIGVQGSKILKVHYQQIKPWIEMPNYLKNLMSFEPINIKISKRNISEDSSSDDAPCFVGGRLISRDSDTSESEETEDSAEDVREKASLCNQKEAKSSCSSTREERKSSEAQDLKEDNLSESKLTKSDRSSSNAEQLTENDLEEGNLVEPGDSNITSEIGTEEENVITMEPEIDNNGEKSFSQISQSNGSKTPESDILDDFQTLSNGIFASTPIGDSNTDLKFSSAMKEISTIKDKKGTKLSLLSIEQEGIEANVESEIKETDESENISEIHNLIKDLMNTPEDGTLEKDTAYKMFVNLMEKAWTFTQSSIELFMEESSESKEIVEENEESDKVQVLPKDDEEQFSGFGTLRSGLESGSARTNFLQTLKTHSKEHKDLAVSFRTGNNKLLRAMWKRDCMDSETRLNAGESDTGSENSETPQQQIDFSISPTVMTTRSKGLPMRLDNVQKKTLEYKTYKKT